MASYSSSRLFFLNWLYNPSTFEFLLLFYKLISQFYFYSFFLLERIFWLNCQFYSFIRLNYFFHQESYFMNYSRLYSSLLRYYNNWFYYCWVFLSSMRVFIVFCLRDQFYCFNYINYGKYFLTFVVLVYSSLRIYSLIIFFFYSTLFVSFNSSLKFSSLFNY